MFDFDQESKPLGSIAPLRNVVALAQMTDRLLGRRMYLPGMGVMYGLSGFGKSTAAMYAANKFRAVHIQCKSVWTKKTLCVSILEEMSIKPAPTVPKMVEQIGEELAASLRPLIVDEADHLAAKGMIEVIRDIYETSFAPIIMLGEQGLPDMLKRWERIDGRVLVWAEAQPSSFADAGHLARLYSPQIEIASDLLTEIHRKSAGSARRIVVNIDGAREQAQTKGLSRIGLADFDGDFFTGAPGRGR